MKKLSEQSKKYLKYILIIHTINTLITIINWIPVAWTLASSWLMLIPRFFYSALIITIIAGVIYLIKKNNFVKNLFWTVLVFDVIMIILEIMMYGKNHYGWFT